MNTNIFKAAMIQMRSGLKPAANIDDAARMIGEAKSAGAEYVLTPEMTNILAAKRQQLLAAAGATMLAIPSAFTQQTGEAHWHVLMRARAIENGCFVFAAAQGGKHENGRETFGHSLIVDPWGRIIAEGGTEPGVVMAEIDPAQVTNARARIPSLQHGRRFEIVEPMAEPAHLHVVRSAE